MTTLTDEQVAEIEKRHNIVVTEQRACLGLTSLSHPDAIRAHIDRAALLSHVKALKAEIAELRKAPAVTREKVLEDALRPIAKFLDRASKRHMGRSWSSLAKDKRVLAVWLAEMTPQSTPDCTMAELFEMHERANAALALLNSRPSPGVQPARTLGDYKDSERARLAREEVARIVNAGQTEGSAQAAPSAFCSACGVSRAEYLIKGCDGVDGAPDENFSGCKMLDRHPAPSQAAVLAPSPSARAHDWVKCPICGEKDMPKYRDDDVFYIHCSNGACASNGGTNASAFTPPSAALTDEELLKLCNEILNGEPAPYETFGQIHTQVTVARAIIDRLTQQGDKP